MNKKLVLALLVAVLIGVGLWLWISTGTSDGGRGARGRGTEAAPTPTAEPEELAASPIVAPTATRSEERSAQVAPAAAPVQNRGELAGLVGRLVEQDGRPVVGMRVALVEFEGSLLFDGSGIDEPEGSLELEETTTNAEGRFLLGGAHASAFHGLGIDLAGPRATFRVIDHALVHRERVDIGDVVLAPYGILTGRVVDEAGQPIGAARIRAAPFPSEVLQAQPQDFRAETLIAVSLSTMGGQGHLVIDPPGWVRSALERFPIPTTTSLDDGTFRLEGVPLATLVVGVDKHGLVGANAGDVDLTSGLHDLGDVVLKHGRTVTGTVEDSDGDPVAGVEVFAGAELVPGIAAMLQPAGVSDENGEFRLEGVYESGSIVAATRRSRAEAWSTNVSPRPDGVLLELPSLVSLTVLVLDPAGQPVSGADVRVAPARSDEQRMGFFDVTAFLPRLPAPTGTFTEVEPGRYVNSKLSQGNYEVEARVAGQATGFAVADCRSETSEVTLTLPVGRRLEVTVIDAASKAPVTAARASVLRASGAGLTKLASKMTGVDGSVVLGPLSDRLSPSSSQGMPDTTILSVLHPRYGDQSVTLEPDATSLVVELQPGGTLAGRVHWGGAVPTKLYMLTLEFRGADDFLELFHLPRFTVTDLGGEFRVTNLVPGKYRVALMERFLQQDPLGMMTERFEPATLFRQEVEIVDGQTTSLEIDLTPTGQGPTARIAGHVRFDGRNLAGAKVSVRGNGSFEVETDSSGRFETQEFSCIEGTWIRIEGEVALGSGPQHSMELYNENRQLQAGEVHQIDLDLYPITLRARVVSAVSGEPVQGAKVTANLQKENQGWFQNDGTKTDGNGTCEVVVLEPGKYALNAEADGFTRSAEMVEVKADGTSEEIVLRLQSAVPCAGHVQVDPSYLTGPGFSYLWVRSDNGSNSGSQIQPPDQAFTLENLAPGKYTATLYVRGKQGEDVEFELGPQGDENLVLVFTPRTNEEE